MFKKLLCNHEWELRWYYLDYFLKKKSFYGCNKCGKIVDKKNDKDKEKWLFKRRFKGDTFL